MTPVAVGAAMVWAADRKVHWLAVLAALLGTIFIQLGTVLDANGAKQVRRR
jgi:1,4-dihydroxy-2-naphthoate octaprenyltransferase